MSTTNSVNHSNHSKLRLLIITAICIALCVVLPFLFHFIPNGGSLFSPMHIPVFICGLVCGAPFGLACGILGPLLSSLLTSMPGPAFLPNMMVELALYGLIAGIMIRIIRTGKPYLDILLSLIAAMILGRIFTGLIVYFFLAKGNYGISVWFAGYFIGTLPGMIVHIILIPIIALALMRAGLTSRD